MKWTVEFRIVAGILLVCIAALWLSYATAPYLLTILPEWVVNWLASPLFTLLEIAILPIIIFFVIRRTKPRT